MESSRSRANQERAPRYASAWRYPRSRKPVSRKTKILRSVFPIASPVAIVEVVVVKFSGPRKAISGAHFTRRGSHLVLPHPRCHVRWGAGVSDTGACGYRSQGMRGVKRARRASAREYQEIAP